MCEEKAYRLFHYDFSSNVNKNSVVSYIHMLKLKNEGAVVKNRGIPGVNFVMDFRTRMHLSNNSFSSKISYLASLLRFEKRLLLWKLNVGKT